MTSQAVTFLSALVRAVKDQITWPVQRMRHLASQAPGLPLMILALLIFFAIRTVRGDRWSAIILLPLSLAWLLFNGPIEGPTLLVISYSHGVTLSDLLSVACVGLSAWRLVPELLHRFA
jgi:hypothetical protein